MGQSLQINSDYNIKVANGAQIVLDTGITNQGIRGKVKILGELDIGGDLTTTAATFNLANTTATTVNFAGAATEINIGNTSSSTSIINIAGVVSTPAIIAGVLSLSNQSTVPSIPVGNVKLYSTNEPGGGGTGLYFVNTAGTNDELISKSKAFTYSLIF
jgi:hypothetical protein